MTLARAFHHDPVFDFLIPNLIQQARAALTFMGTVVLDGMPFHEVWVAREDELVAGRGSVVAAGRIPARCSPRYDQPLPRPPVGPPPRLPCLRRSAALRRDRPGPSPCRGTSLVPRPARDRPRMAAPWRRVRARHDRARASRSGPDRSPISRPRSPRTSPGTGATGSRSSTSSTRRAVRPCGRCAGTPGSASVRPSPSGRLTSPSTATISAAPVSLHLRRATWVSWRSSRSICAERQKHSIAPATRPMHKSDVDTAGATDTLSATGVASRSVVRCIGLVGDQPRAAASASNALDRLGASSCRPVKTSSNAYHQK